MRTFSYTAINSVTSCCFPKLQFNLTFFELQAQDLVTLSINLNPSFFLAETEVSLTGRTSEDWVKGLSVIAPNNRRLVTGKTNQSAIKVKKAEMKRCVDAHLR